MWITYSFQEQEDVSKKGEVLVVASRTTLHPWRIDGFVLLQT